VNVYAIGLNHSKTPVAIRGKLAIGASRLSGALLRLRAEDIRGLILSTCNRTEVYALGDRAEDVVPRIVAFLNANAKLPETELSRHLYVYSGRRTVRHLFRVSSGLDSMIVGESEILGQVKTALEEAERAGPVDLPLQNLFRAAIRVGRMVRTKTGISRNALSVGAMAVALAEKSVGDMSRCKIMVIGAGEAGRKVAQTIRERGAKEIVVVSRNPSRGAKLAEMLGGVWSPMDQLDRELTDNDILICCSGAPHTIIKFESLQKIMAARAERPLVIIDIAVPPDVDSRTKELRGVYLYDLDALTASCRRNRETRRGEIRPAKRLIEEDVEKFCAVWESSEANPLIRALMRKADRIRQAQLERSLKNMKGLSAEDRGRLEAMTVAIIHNVFQDPIRRLRFLGSQGKKSVAVLAELFDLERGDA